MSFLYANALEADKSLVTELDDNVAVLQIFPGISTATIRGFLTHLRGAVISSYGAGNIPQRDDVLEVIKEACDRGVVIVNITQCVKGSVLAYCKFFVLWLYGYLCQRELFPIIRSRYDKAGRSRSGFRSRHDPGGSYPLMNTSTLTYSCDSGFRQRCQNCLICFPRTN